MCGAALLALAVKTQSLGFSSAEVELLICVPLEADLINRAPWLQAIRSQSMVGLSMIEMDVALGPDCWTGA